MALNLRFSLVDANKPQLSKTRVQNKIQGDNQSGECQRYKVDEYEETCPSL